MPDSAKGVTLRLEPELWRRLKIHTLDTGESIQALSVRLLTEYLDKQDKAKKS